MGTLHLNPARGAQLLGLDLKRCYEGEYLNGKRHGVGTYRYRNNFYTFHGEYVNGLKQGHGKLSMRDGSWYEGNFEDDEIQGQGTKHFSAGHMYSGSFLRGELHGRGSMRLSNGDCYEGEFRSNCFSGHGVYRRASGDLYEGDMALGKFCGQGRMDYVCGDRYEGRWRAGLRHGQGLLQQANGDTYEGEWEDDQPHGLGCSRQVLSGISYMGRFVRGQAAQVPARLSVSLGQAAAGSEKQGRRQQQAEGGDRRRTDMSEVAEAAAAGGQAPKPKPLKAGTPAAIAAAAAAAAGAQLVQMTLGHPLATPIIVTAEAPVAAGSDSAAEDNTSASQPGNAEQPSTVSSAAAPVSAAGPAVQKQAAASTLSRNTSEAAALGRLGAAATSPGSEYEAAEMESGRTVNVTLHRCSAPGAQQQEMAGGGSGPLHMVLCSTLLPDGSTRVRVLLFSEQDKLPGPPLPLTTCPAGELVTSLQTTLARGTAELGAVTIGLPVVQPDGTPFVYAHQLQAAPAVSAPERPVSARASKQGGAVGTPRTEAALARAAAGEAAALLMPTAHQMLLLPAGVYLLLFTSPGVAAAQMVVNLVAPVVKGAAAKAKAVKE